MKVLRVIRRVYNGKTCLMGAWLIIRLYVCRALMLKFYKREGMTGKSQTFALLKPSKNVFEHQTRIGPAISRVIRKVRSPSGFQKDFREFWLNKSLHIVKFTINIITVII